jgi:hypothetical protein
MSTNGSFTPPSDAACPYPTYMTHAEAVALRDANGLDPRCQIVITDGPVIGVPGFTSPTQIELNPAGPGDIGRNARIHTDFDNIAFLGLYNLDAGPNGEINEIVDHWNNTVSDEDSGAPTVHTQFPFHASSANLRDNRVNDCTITDWHTAVVAGVLITDNDLLHSGIHLTGMVDGTFTRNRIQGPQITISSPNVAFNSNDIRNAPVTFAGTSAAAQSFQANAMFSGIFEVTSATTGAVTADRNVIDGTGIIGYRVLVDGATAPVLVSGNRLFSQSVNPTYDLRVAATGSVSVTNNELNRTQISLEGNGASAISGSALRSTVITKDLDSTGPLTVTGCEIGGATITVGPANAAVTNLFNAAFIRQGVFTLNGPVAAPARNDFVSTNIGSMAVNIAATATAGVLVNGGYHDGVTINQNRTAGTEATRFFDCDTRGVTTITDNGTVDPVQGVGFNRCELRDVIVNIGDLAARTLGNSTVMQQVDAIGSTITVSGLGATGLIDKGRLTGCTLDNGGFAVDTFEMLGGTKTLTADQSQRLFNPAFDNFV